MRPAECNIPVDHFIAVLGEILYVLQKTINQETQLAALNLDSLDLFQAALELEATLGCEVPDGTLIAARTVGDLAACFAGRPPRPALPTGAFGPPAST
jgi:acyl carrier protein